MKRFLSVFICLLLITGLTLSDLTAFGTSNTITINSEKDLIKLAKNCSLDSWSAGKDVVLKKDIDLSKTSFKYIPTFSGTFDGNGHTISGIKITKSGSYQGLFRYIKYGSEVKNLIVSATIVPSGTASKLGGIAGSNSGSIINCKFKGTIKGKNYIGGIAGINTFEGSITNSSSDGTVYGEHYSGGITGQNLGSIISCSNDASVNTSATKIKMDINDINFDKIVSTENTIEITDIGGIAGFSSGIIQSCINNGIVGYTHVGYNVGGIAGRQSGYLNSCENYGEIFGRKDVGGIAGQIEPYTVLRYSDNSMNDLSFELSKLQSLLNNTLNNADSKQSTVSAKIRELKGYTDDAVDSADTLADKTKDLLNTNVDNLNNTSARLTETLDSISNSLDGIDELSENLDLFIDTTKQITKIMKNTSKNINTDELTEALDELGKASRKLKIASNQLSNGIREMRWAINDISKIASATKDTIDAFRGLKNALGETSNSIKSAGKAAKKISEQISSGNLDGLDAYFKEFSNALNDIGSSVDKASLEFDSINSALTELSNSIQSSNIGGLVSGASNMASAFYNIGNAMGNIDNALSALRNAVSEIDIDDLKSIANKANKSVDYLQNAFDSLHIMASEIADATKKLSQSPIITIKPIDDDYIETSDKLSKNISNMSNSFDSLNSLVSGSITSLISDFQAVSDQMFVVFNIMIDAIENSYDTNIKDELSNRFSDISEEDTASQTTGKVSYSTNHSNVNGDLNVGGIVGQMAIEYDFDPEDDIAKDKKRSSDFLFTTRAVVRNCLNTGEITAKKNCVGGIAGKINLGCVLQSDGCGIISSKSGSYVGGIAGYSESVLKNNNAKCTLSGNDYIGGIAGKAAHIYDCRAVVYIEHSNENIGSIAGATTGECKRNIFCNDSLGGIDSISYNQIAEPVSIDTLTSSKNGDIFKKFTATFKVDGKITDAVDYEYNGSIEKSQLPKIPKKKNKYAVWDITNFKNLKRDVMVNALYKPYISAVESKLTRNNKLPVIVAEGKYSKDTIINTKKISNKNIGGFYKSIDAYTITLSETFDKHSKIHYLPPNDKPDKTIIFVSSKNGLYKAKSHIDGSYLVFDINGDKTTFFVVQSTILHTVFKYAVIILLLIAFLQILIIYINIYKKKKRAKMKL